MESNTFAKGVSLFIALLLLILTGTYVFNSFNGHPASLNYAASGSGVSERVLHLTVLNRHGDRAPVGKLAKVDRHAEKPNFFWPNGLSNLTDMGERRMYKLGVTLRRMYKDFLDYDTQSVLALTSNSFRCKQSQQATLRGLFSIHSTLENGLHLAGQLRERNTSHVPGGAGTSNIWDQIPQDPEFLPSLDESWYGKTPYAKAHPSPLNTDVRNDPHIKILPGIEKLCKLLQDRYELQCDSTVDLWTQVECELYLDRTNETIGYMDHFADWVNDAVAHDSSLGQVVTMYELFEQVLFFGYVHRIDPNGHYLITAPIANAILEAQSVALGRPATSERAQKYVGKKLLLGSTHDIILTVILNDMGVIPVEGQGWAKRLMEAKKKGLSDVEIYRLGLKMPHFGVSVRIELVQVESSTSGASFPMVRLGIYSEPDPNAPTVEWTPAPLGEVCQRRFKELNGAAKDPMSFYPPSSSKIKVNTDYDCPYELFREILKPFEFDEQKHESLLNGNQ